MEKGFSPQEYSAHKAEREKIADPEHYIQEMAQVSSEDALHQLRARGDGMVPTELAKLVESFEEKFGSALRWHDVAPTVEAVFKHYLARTNLFSSPVFDTVVSHVDALVRLREKTGASFRLEPQQVESLFRQFLSSPFPLPEYAQIFKTICALGGEKIDFEKYRPEIQSVYASYQRLYMRSSINPHDAAIINGIIELTGVRPAFSPQEIQDVYSSAVDPGLWEKIIKEPMSASVAGYRYGRAALGYGLDNQQFFRYVEKSGIGVDWAAAASSMLEEPENAFKNIENPDRTFRDMPDSQREDLVKAVRRHPWFAVFGRLRSEYPMQFESGRAAKGADSEWKKNIQPLLASLLQKKSINLGNARDAKNFFETWEALGTFDRRKLFTAVLMLRQARSLNDLPPGMGAMLEKLGIKLTTVSGGETREYTPLELSKALVETRQRFQNDVFADRVPVGLETALGKEIFKSLYEKSAWEVGGDSPDELLAQWQETIQEKPELANLPPGYQEVDFAVPIMKSRASSEQKQQEAVRILSFSEYQTTFLPLINDLSEACRPPRNPQEAVLWWSEEVKQLSGALQKEADGVRGLLTTDVGALERMLEMETDERAKKILKGRIKMLSSEKGRLEARKKISRLESLQQEADSMGFDAAKVIDEVAIVKFIEKLARLSDQSSAFEATLRRLSAYHLSYVMPEGWKQQIAPFINDSALTLENVAAFAKVSQFYLKEHYFHPAQKQDHTQHTPFSAPTLAVLKRIWQQFSADSEGHTPIELLDDKLVRLTRPQGEETGETRSVAMVPARGLMRIMSGDLGDACFTSQHHALARGDYPNITAWVYVADRHGAQEAVKGSMLGIKTLTEDGVPAHIARANNPVENFIRTVDAKQFVLASLKEVVAVARREHEALAGAQKQCCVALPLDRASESSSNRESVASVYWKCFSTAPKVGLRDEPETNFNGYAIWDKDGKHPCVKIWEINEHGEEVWYGKWENEEKRQKHDSA